MVIGDWLKRGSSWVHKLMPNIFAKSTAKLDVSNYMVRTCNQQIWKLTVIVSVQNVHRFAKLSQWNFLFWWIWLSAKRCANGGSDFWLSIKSVSNTLSCCFVCAFIIGQYHSGNNMSSKSGAAGEIKKIESEKRHGIQPLKTDTLTVSAFDAFTHVHDDSKHYLSHRFAQRRYCFTQCI